MRCSHVALALCAALLTAAAARADEKSAALVKKAAETTAAYKTLQTDVVLKFEFQGQKQEVTADLMLLKPNYGRLRIIGRDGKPMQSLVSDGKSFYVVLDMQQRFIKQGGSSSHAPFRLDQVPLAPIFAPEKFFAGAETRHAGTQTIDGRAYEVVEFTAKQPTVSGKVFFGPSGLVEGAEIEEKGEQATRGTVWTKNLKLDAPLKAQQFAFKAPAGYKELEQPGYEKSLLAVGKPAPDFQLPQPGGGQLSLSEALKGKKAVLINFWFYG